LVLSYEEMTREERADLMINDWETYKELVPSEYWLMLLDGVARAGPCVPEEQG
jgi:hypothetical protein